MDEKIWWKCNGRGYLIQQDVGKQTPEPCPACKQDCTFTNHFFDHCPLQNENGCLTFGMEA